jgi:hypothetical protein
VGRKVLACLKRIVLSSACLSGQRRLYMEKKTKKKLTVEELDLEQLEDVTGGADASGTSSPGLLESPFKMNTGKPLPIMI